MDIVTVGFLVFGFLIMIISFILEGGHITALLAPTAAMIVFGGTVATVGVSFPASTLKKLPKIFGVLFKKHDGNLVKLIIYFKEVAYKTRKDGLLSLENDLSDNNMDPFIKKALQLIVDGTDPQVVKGVLELDVEAASERHKEAASMFEAAGGFSPTMGIIGTVMGLVHVLGSLEDPSSLGPKIAVAFIATLYGVGFANLAWLPIAAKLKALDNEEFKEKVLIMEAVLAIQEGVNPNTISEKLKGFLDKQQLIEFEKLDRVAG
ncbi:flagellar motor protein [Clostridium lundense]|uniref:flagellar motor protein n=1 Tax=Clostridium lundense TaxID=319475 RepID=UPI00047F7EDC|nr:flagellar motor protein [Clostridium lundense]